MNALYNELIDTKNEYENIMELLEDETLTDAKYWQLVDIAEELKQTILELEEEELEQYSRNTWIYNGVSPRDFY